MFIVGDRRYMVKSRIPPTTHPSRNRFAHIEMLQRWIHDNVDEQARQSPEFARVAVRSALRAAGQNLPSAEPGASPRPPHSISRQVRKSCGLDRWACVAPPAALAPLSWRTEPVPGVVHPQKSRAAAGGAARVSGSRPLREDCFILLTRLFI